MTCMSAHACVCLSSVPCPRASLLCLNLLCNVAGACLHENSHLYLDSPILIPKDGPARSAWLGWHAGDTSHAHRKAMMAEVWPAVTHDSSWPAVTAGPRSVELTGFSFRYGPDTFPRHFLSPIHSQGELTLVVPWTKLSYQRGTRPQAEGSYPAPQPSSLNGPFS